ncbi:hypothetical protein [Smaragdicoccus niigatensis]|uniref:hypothetical protein n=1 Tax=Smaragdicoccus niigatensis TaxID=359359 RepID=UPI00039F5C03|nr:hypothetical protein [Smaragdicoccus niigatensis]
MALVRSPGKLVSGLVWFSVLAFFAAACSGTPDTSGNKPLPAAAEQVMTSAIDTMFTWNPTVDPGPGAAFTRAAPFLSDRAIAANQAVAQDTVAGWVKWKKDADKITADVYVGTDRPDAAPADTDNSFTRPVKVVQNVVGPDGGTIETFTFTLEQVVVTLTGAKWLVDSISNIDRAGGGLCPAGEIETSGSCQPETTTTAPPTTTNKPIPVTTIPPAPVPITTVPPPPPCMPGDPACSPPNPCAAPGSCQPTTTCTPGDPSCSPPNPCAAPGSCQPPPCMPGDPACSPPNPCAEPGSCETTPYNPNNCAEGMLCISDPVYAVR